MGAHSLQASCLLMPAQALPQGTARSGTARLMVPAWGCSTPQGSEGGVYGCQNRSACMRWQAQSGAAGLS